MTRPWKLAALGLLSIPLMFAQSANIDDFFRDFTADWVRRDPNLATQSRYFTGPEQDRLERQLTPVTREFRLARIRLARQGLLDLARFDRARMTEIQRVSADVMQSQLQTIADEEPFLDYSFPLEQFNGVNVWVGFRLTIDHPMRTEKDSENYVAALGEAGARMQEATAESRRLSGKGLLPPKFILDATIRQMQGFADPAPAQNAFVTSFAQKMTAIKSLPEAKREELRARAERIVSEQIYPAWKEAIALLESQAPHATDEAGISRVKNGAEFYAYSLRRFTTTNLTAAQIHEIGLKRVAEIEAQQDTLLRRLGRTEGTVKERIARLRTDLAYPDPTSEESRAQIMRDIEGILRDAEKRAALLFDKRPKAPVIAEPYPRFLEAAQAARYSGPTPDGSRPGTFLYPRRPERMTKFGLRTTVYHETVPGHHFQVALEVENRELPRFRQIGAFGIISAFAEGWGLYAEHLAAESGWYDGDIEGQLGQLDSELWRARRLVVDTGIHAQHWTRQQAIDYGIEASEVDRYAIWPGQACSYMIGELKIIELREKARKALGNKFSIREYHNVVLDTGTVPLDVLERQVDAYIRSKGGRV
jgi:uncharacterized protein (DUF885 family)